MTAVIKWRELITLRVGVEDTEMEPWRKQMNDTLALMLELGW